VDSQLGGLDTDCQEYAKKLGKRVGVEGRRNSGGGVQLVLDGGETGKTLGVESFIYPKHSHTAGL
jgi:hypothetical protein